MFINFVNQQKTYRKVVNYKMRCTCHYDVTIFTLYSCTLNRILYKYLRIISVLRKPEVIKEPDR